MRPRSLGSDDEASECAAWWSTAITRVQPNEIDICGYPIAELIGTVSFPGALLLMTGGELATSARVALLEAAMVASVDHGPQAPSVAAGRMAATCGVGFQSVVAAGVSLLGDVHGGAGQQCLQLLNETVAADGDENEDAGRQRVSAVVERWLERDRYLPGFGHRYHTLDPRAVRLNALVQSAVTDGHIAGRHLRAADQIGDELERRRGRRLTLNIDGATATIYGELGLAPELARAVFVLSRSVGIIANAWEERQAGNRLKGPIPRSITPAYVGPASRHVPDMSADHDVTANRAEEVSDKRDDPPTP